MHDERTGEVLPNLLPYRGRLYLSPPCPQTAAALREVFYDSGLIVEEPAAGVLLIQLQPDRLEALADSLADSLSAEQLYNTKVCASAAGVTPTAAVLMRTQSLSKFVAMVHNQWLCDVLRQRSLVTYFQPIVACREPRKVFAYECLVRGRQDDGGLIYPNKLYAAARVTGLLPQLDREARRTAIETAAQRRLETHVFINFNPRSLDESPQGLEDTLDAAARSGIQTKRFVFEVVESDEIDDVDRLLLILDHYRSAGFQVALDDLGAGYSSLRLLARIKPDFVKLDMELIRDVDRDHYQSQIAAKLLELARELNVTTVVEGVETKAQLQWAREHGADYAQGYYFARPAAVPWVPAGDEIRAPDSPAIPSGITMTDFPAMPDFSTAR